ncbi:MAG: EAL domain-containing response regulator [Candidatus Omnitrophota bacterium]
MVIKKLILIIDDDPDFIATMQYFLENSNYNVIKALCGNEGINMARHKPDLILLDLKMPDISGHEVCKRLKENSETRNIPIVMLTSHKATIDKVEAFNLGVVDYIDKDCPFDEMLARFKAVLRSKSSMAIASDVQENNKKIMALREAIDKKDLRILFQPIVNLTSCEPIGYEALTRGPRGTFLESPVALFNLASESNMFFELEALCRNLSIKKATFIKKDKLLFLNTDPGAIYGKDFKDLEFLKGSAITPDQICIEITERTCIKDYARLSNELSHYRSMGMKVAIDDVGAGYSSLSAIAEIKPDFIKIDIALVSNLDTNDLKKHLVQAIVSLAEKLNLSIIAEGIERKEEHEALRGFGVQNGQGYLFARPAEMT